MIQFERQGCVQRRVPNADANTKRRSDSHRQQHVPRRLFDSFARVVSEESKKRDLDARVFHHTRRSDQQDDPHPKHVLFTGCRDNHRLTYKATEQWKASDRSAANDAKHGCQWHGFV